MLAARKLHKRIDFRGLKISIENRKGSIRSGVNSYGKVWRTKLSCDYGYLLGTRGTDNDAVDVFVGPNKDAKNVYIIHTKDPKTKAYDEDKCVVGANSVEEAKKIFFDNYDNPSFFGGMTVMTFDEFKQKVLATKDNPQMLKARE